MDKRQAKKEYLRSIQPMGIVQVKNLKDGRCLLMRSANTGGTINSLRFQLNSGAFPTSQQLLRDWKKLGESSFTIEVIDELEATDDPARDCDAELHALEELWLERLQPFDELGYHSRKRRPQS